MNKNVFLFVALLTAAVAVQASENATPGATSWFSGVSSAFSKALSAIKATPAAIAAIPGAVVEAVKSAPSKTIEGVKAAKAYVAEKAPVKFMNNNKTTCLAAAGALVTAYGAYCVYNAYYATKSTEERP